MDRIKSKYEHLCSRRSDINEHLPTLYKYASECDSVIELGVRGVVSSYAFIYGLLNNQKSTKKIFMNDISPCNINNILDNTKTLDIDVKYKWINDLQLEIPENYDITFIDTWHVYAQLKRELDKFSQVTNKYIIMHDTTVDGIHGESMRKRMNIESQSKNTGFPIDEISKGLQPAIDEFLVKNSNWKVKEVFTNNNGLTILERIE